MKKLSLLLICIQTILFSGYAQIIQTQSAVGCTVKIKSAYSGKIAQVGYASNDNGAMIYTYSDGTATHFNWQVIDAGRGYLKFKNQNSGKYLAVHGGQTAPGTAILQHEDNGGEEFLWELRWQNNNSFKLVNKKSGKPMAIEGGSRGDARIVQWNDDNQGDIIWQLWPVGNCGQATGRKILYDIVLNHIAVSEATRQQIDNGDCKRIFGSIITELWELDENNNPKTQLPAFNNMQPILYNQNNHQSPPPIALSQYQDNVQNTGGNQMGKVTYNIPEGLLQNKKVMLVLKINMGSRHKDNDFATFDYLAMENERSFSWVLDNQNSRNETAQVNTDQNYSGRDKHILDWVVPFHFFKNTDDTHNIWVKINCKKN
jgi:hypothetical protein